MSYYRRRRRSRTRRNPPGGMHVVYMPVNAAWTVLFGAAGMPMHERSIVDIDGKRFWPDRGSLVSALGRLGLAVSKSGEVTAR